MDTLQTAQQEIYDFHTAIRDWFRGAGAADTDVLLQNFSTDFKMVSPDGSLKSLADLASWLPPGFGKIPDMEISVKIIDGYATDKHALISYEETQASGGQSYSRMSSAVFIREGARMLWLNLWETF
ncbi:hypothetical protein [Chitinophaga solisilvae]|uniref:hypothetical protein n=1 Tax=Chitinophaga solisilvae TaxID=1233460 RepID=UPI00136862BC|nr:hypothetical protein [Chitinophaga solisilvae]